MKHIIWLLSLSESQARHLVIQAAKAVTKFSVLKDRFRRKAVQFQKESSYKFTRDSDLHVLADFASAANIQCGCLLRSKSFLIRFVRLSEAVMCPACLRGFDRWP